MPVNALAHKGFQGRTMGMAWKLLEYSNYMNSSGHLPLSESAVRRVRKGKRKPRAKTRANVSRPELPAVGTLTRTKALLLAALRVWELKHRLPE